MMKTIITSSLAAIIVATFTGCVMGGATPPLSYLQQMPHYDNIDSREKEKIVKAAFNKEVHIHPFKSNHPRFKNTKYGCCSITFVGLNATYSHEFYLDDDDMLDREDKSRLHHGNERGKAAYCTLCDDFGFSDYINDFQKKLGKTVSEYLNAYSKCKNAYIIANTKLQKKLDSIKPVINDKTAILPKNMLGHLKEAITKSKVSSPLNVQNCIPRNKMTYYINVAQKLSKMGRYSVVFDKTQFNGNTESLPSEITFNVVSVKFNYLPEQFNFSDKNLAVEAQNGKLYFHNKTNSFLSIEGISSYFNGDITQDSNLKIMLSPKSKSNYALNRIYSSVEVTSRDQQVEYGFAISYYNQDINKRNTLFNTKKLSIKDFR